MRDRWKNGGPLRYENLVPIIVSRYKIYLFFFGKEIAGNAMNVVFHGGPEL